MECNDNQQDDKSVSEEKIEVENNEVQKSFSKKVEDGILNLSHKIKKEGQSLSNNKIIQSGEEVLENAGKIIENAGVKIFNFGKKIINSNDVKNFTSSLKKMGNNIDNSANKAIQQIKEKIISKPNNENDKGEYFENADGKEIKKECDNNEK